MRSLLAAALALALAVAIPLADPSIGSQDPEVFCPGYRAVERTWYETDALLWPPGATRCEYATPTGETRVSTRVQWGEWLILALLVASVVLAGRAVKRRFPGRGARVYAGAAALLAVGGVLLAGVWAALLVPLVLVAGAAAALTGRALAVRMIRGRSRWPRPPHSSR